MSIRDIIEAAKSDWVLDGMSPAGSMFLDHEDDQRFIATFDPEHVSLMEAERVAAREFIIDLASGVGFDVKKYDRYVDACRATYAYRKERGL